jgi:hypothetical protein
MLDIVKLEKIHNKVNKILLDSDSNDYQKYLKISKIKSIDDNPIGQDKTLKIIYEWLMDNSEYNEERDRFNGHNWRIEYEKRFEKLIDKINNNSKKNNPKKSVNNTNNNSTSKNKKTSSNSKTSVNKSKTSTTKNNSKISNSSNKSSSSNKTKKKSKYVIEF